MESETYRAILVVAIHLRRNRDDIALIAIPKTATEKGESDLMYKPKTPIPGRF
jgi:hypothetical protein